MSFYDANMFVLESCFQTLCFPTWRITDTQVLLRVLGMCCSLPLATGEEAWTLLSKRDMKTQLRCSWMAGLGWDTDYPAAEASARQPLHHKSTPQTVSMIPGCSFQVLPFLRVGYLDVMLLSILLLNRQLKQVLHAHYVGSLTELRNSCNWQNGRPGFLLLGTAFPAFREDPAYRSSCTLLCVPAASPIALSLLSGFLSLSSDTPSSNKTIIFL